MFDFDINNQKINDEIEKESLAKFIDNVRSNVSLLSIRIIQFRCIQTLVTSNQVVGVGEVVEVDRDGFLDRATRNMTMNGDNGEMNEDGQKTILPTVSRFIINQLIISIKSGLQDMFWSIGSRRCRSHHFSWTQRCKELLLNLSG